MHGYYPEDPVAAAKVDMLVDTYLDFLPKFYGPFFQPEEKRPELMKEIVDKLLPTFMKNVEPYLDGQWLVGDKITIADFWIGGLYTNFMNHAALGYCADDWAKTKEAYPKFCAYGERYAAENAAYLASRPTVPL